MWIDGVPSVGHVTQELRLAHDEISMRLICGHASHEDALMESHTVKDIVDVTSQLCDVPIWCDAMH